MTTFTIARGLDRFDPRTNKVWYLNVIMLVISLVLLWNFRKSPHFWGILGALFLMGISIIVEKNSVAAAPIVSQPYAEPTT